jgi:hypothetical protein
MVGRGKAEVGGPKRLLTPGPSVESMGIQRIGRDVEGEMTQALRGVTAFVDDG